MGETMTFPDHFMDFIKNYSFKDKEEIYTNGSDLIQTYRVEQAWEHYTNNINQILNNLYDCTRIIESNLTEIEYEIET